jgi:hypothetical protein
VPALLALLGLTRAYGRYNGLVKAHIMFKDLADVP